MPKKLEGPPSHWQWPASKPFELAAPPPPKMAVVFLIDRTYEKFLRTVVDAVLRVYDNHLMAGDLVGFYGLGDGWIFEMGRKGEPDDGERGISSAMQQLPTRLNNVLRRLAG